MRVRTQSIMEALETRRLLSGATLTDAGVLRVWGDDLKVNTITIGNSVDGLSVEVSIASTNALNVTKTISRSFLKSAGISSLYVTGGAKNDVINTLSVNSPFTIAMRVDGRGGADQIDTGEANDLVYGGGGDDDIDANGGNDRVFAALGNDTVDAGGGDDRVSGGWGNDTLRLGGGDDFARGDAGDDFIYGHNGMDTIYGCGGIDELYGERDNDSLWGGLGNDRLFGGDDNDTLGGVLGTNIMMGEDGFDSFVVVRLALQPTNDFLAGTDSEVQVTGTTEGPPLPLV